MSQMTENFEELAEIVSKVIPKDSNKCNNELLKHVEKLTYVIEHQEKVSVSIATASDVIEEYLDKLRFECKNKQYECDTLEKKVKEMEQKQQRLVIQSSKQDIQAKKKLSKLKAQLEMYESILEVGIEDLGNGRLRGVIFKPNSISYCNLDRGDRSSEENKENNILDSQRRHAELNSIYSQLEVSDDWKRFL
ncbi:unnamed protein product [Hymenolepis diminuta]|uniref:Kinetochore protein Spc24 n=1 Tax=Hymenolepis diminuta TaxID=6216 RepID=A0A0R3SU64_HYMDI|nr:unnamed protein product [Hymenolepis diminuta]VUZ53073.1 unnamed protein product [Hymenolepis diminuta]